MKKQLLATLVFLFLCLPCLALADHGNTYPRLEELTDGKYSQSASVFSLTRSGDYTIADAIADDKFPKADAERLSAYIPKGMSATSVIEDGLITVTVDLADSDWMTLLANLSSYPYVNFRHTLDRPDNAYDHHVGFGGNGVPYEPYDRVLHLMGTWITWGEGDNIQSGNGETSCEIIPATSMVLPGRNDESTHIIGWLDHDTQTIYYEYYKVKTIVKDSSAFHIPFRYVTQATLSATESVSLPSGVSVKSISNGDITFRTASGFEQADVTIALNAPASASYMVINAPEHFSGKVYPQNGTVSFPYQLHGSRTQEEQFTVAWYDSSDNLMNYGLFMLHAEPADFAAWPYYEADWHAVPDSRISLTNNAESIGVTFTYNDVNGDLHIGYEQVEAVTGYPGSCTAMIKAPEGAVCYRVNHSGGNNIMGQDSHSAEDQNNVTGAQDLQYVPEDGWIEIMSYEPVRVIQAGPVEVYIQMGEGEAWPYAGGVFSIFWYKSEAQAAEDNGTSPMRKEYVSDTMGSLCITKRVEVVESEDDIQEPVKDITCVGGKHYKDGWHLRIHHYPHKGDRAHHYELVMENEYGVYQPLEGTMVFYIPYPSGHVYDTEKNCAMDGDTQASYELYHYNENYDACSVVTAQPHPYGVRFETDSLSPFVLDWGDYQGSLTPEQGGGDEGGGEGGDRFFHLQRLDMQPDHRVTMEGLRVRNVDAFFKGHSVARASEIENLCIIFDPADQSETGGEGVILTDGTLVDFLLIEAVSDPCSADIQAPFLHLTGGARVNMLMISEPLAERLQDWLSFEEVDNIDQISIDGNATSFRDFMGE